MTGLQPYPAYEDSGVEWLGRLPAGWSVEPLGKLFAERRQTVSDSDYPPLSVTREGVVPQLENVAKTSDGDGRKLVRAGDFAINSRSDRKGSSGLADRDGSVSVITTVITPRNLDRRFIHHLLRSSPFQEEFYRYGTGIVADLWSTRWSAMKSIRLPVPRKDEQRAIASFLDRETAEIDAFIADQEELIRLLTERRAATISHAVTKGLDTSAPMVSTGLAWPSRVPASWRRCSIRNVFRVLDCKHTTAEFEPDGEYALASIREVKGDFVDLAHAKRTNRPSFVSLTEGGRAPLPGDLIVSRNASVGEVAMVPDGLGDFAMGQDVSLIRDPSNENRTSFLAYVLRSRLGTDAFAAASIGSTFKRINVDDIKAVTFWMPEASDEAADIASYLQRETAEVDAAIADAREAIALSRERRAALISAAVTGKIDVREHAHSGVA